MKSPPEAAGPQQITRLRALPQVERLMTMPQAGALVGEFSRGVVLAAVRRELQALRHEILDGAGHPFSAPAFFDALRTRLSEQNGAGLRRAINATGIVLHTNLGRAPLAAEALKAAVEINAGYVNLELDLASGRRGSRHDTVARLLRELTAAPAALAVNNNAAAVLLALSALAAGGEVVISRGELVEIGGSFRMPDIIEQSGARLVEVGTTNKTRLSDYEQAITADTRVLLKVHRSNYRIAGFTGDVSTHELAALGRARELPLVEDLGSGSLVDLRAFGLPYEPTVSDTIEAGADLVTFSGDKLLGGPQGGLIVGREALIGRITVHPLLRAVRPDKLTLAALEATLALYQRPEELRRTLPVLRMLVQGELELQARAERLCELLVSLADVEVGIDQAEGYAGGGSLPEVGLATRVVRVRPSAFSAAELARRLRTHRPAVVARIANDRVILDMRTITDQEVAEVGWALRGALA